MSLAKNLRPRWVLFIAFVAHVSLYLASAWARREIVHDEGITLLVITGHQGFYEQIVHSNMPPHLAWVPAIEWQRLLAMDPGHPAQLDHIATDLAKFDIHPPLYFWLFSLVARVFGASLVTGLGLNLALNSCTIVGVYFLAKRILRNDGKASIAAALWALSPGVFEGSLEIRQYALLGLWATLFALITSVWADPDDRPSPLLSVAAVGIAALGILTHYHFVLLVAASCLLVSKSYIKTNRYRAISFCAASLTGVVLGLLAHPYLFSTLASQNKSPRAFTALDIFVRFGGVLVGMGRFVVWSVPLIVVWMIALIVGIIMLVRMRKEVGAIVSNFDPAVLRTLALWAMTFGAQAALFLSFRSPPGAMRAKYLAIDYPLIACLLAWALTHPRVRRQWLRGICAVMVISSSVMGIVEFRAARQIEASKDILPSTKKIVFDTIARGALPVNLWNVPHDMPVFAGNQRDVLSRATELSKTLEPGTLIVMDPERGTKEGREALRKMVPDQFGVEEFQTPLFRSRIVYRVFQR